MPNPIIQHKFTADPTVIVYDDTVYLYTGRDEALKGESSYNMNEWLCFSSRNLVDWQEHPLPLKPTDFTWASGDAYASKVIYANKKFYWYVAVSHAELEGKAIGVAEASTPMGPFKDARGSALITHDMIPEPAGEKANLDPTVLVDDDGKGYIIWGNGRCYFATLNKNLLELDGQVRTLELPGFTEGAHIHKRNGWYYLSYGYGFPEKVAYAMSRNIQGPWEFKGILNEIAGNCETNRPCIVDFKGNTYFFYHNGSLPDGGSHRRSVCIDRLYYNEDETIRRVVMTSEGVSAQNQ